MKIVILDGYTVNPGDLGWGRIERLGDCTIYDRTSPDRLLERASGAEIILTNKTELNRVTLSSLPELKYIGVLATGVNVVDLEYTAKNNIIVTNIPDYAGRSTAQMVFALLLELTNRVGHHSHAVHANRWSESLDFCFRDFPLIELDGLTIGIIGWGDIGKTVSGIATAFGMKSLVNTRTVPEEKPANVNFCDLDTLFQTSDIVTLHCPLTPKTKGMVNADRISQMKKTSYLINASRGALIVEEDLANALNHDKLAGAALDVLIQEPAAPDCPLLNAKNCYITPHIAWATFAARKRLIDIATGNINAFIAGKNQNTVTP